MPIATLLSCGVPYTLQTNVVYALPVVKTTCFSDSAGAALEQSSIIDFSVKSAITLTGGQAVLSGVFIRATSGTPTIVLKRD